MSTVTLVKMVHLHNKILMFAIKLNNLVLEQGG